MKKVVLILLSVSLVLILAGAAFAVAGGLNLAEGIHISAKSDHSKRLSEPQTTTQTIETSKCESVKLNLVNSKLNVEKYDGSDIKIEYVSFYENEWDYELSDGLLTLEYNRYKEWQKAVSSFRNFLEALKSGEFFNIDFDTGHEQREIKLYIPENVSLDYDVHAVNGSIAFDKISAQDVTFDVVNTGLDINDTTVQNRINIKEVNGTINMKNVKASTLNCSSLVNANVGIEAPQFSAINVKNMVNGRFDITGAKNPELYAVKYKLVNGHVNVGGSSYNKNGEHTVSNAICKIDFDGVNSSLNISE